MWWKIGLAVLMVWLCFGLVVALAKGLLALAVVGLVAIGIMVAVKALSKSAPTGGRDSAIDDARL